MESRDQNVKTPPRRAIARAPIVLVVNAYSRSEPATQRATMLAAALQLPLVVGGQAVSTKTRPQLAVIGDGSSVATCAFDLLDQLDAPILVARAAMSGGSIVASSDLRRAEHPVLREAVRFGRLLGKRITFVHNVRELAEGSGLQILPEHESETYLRLIAMHSRCDASAVVVTEQDTTSAIIEVAEFDGADIVVVGHRPHAGCADPARCVAAAVIERCTSSVLLVPIPSKYA